MNKKKILIAIFFTAILLLIPFTTVSSKSTIITNILEKSSNTLMEESDSIKLYNSYMKKIEKIKNLPLNEMEIEAQKILDSIKKDYGHNPEINTLCTELTETLYITPEGKDLASCSKEELTQETQRRIDITMQKHGDNPQIATMCTELSNILNPSKTFILCNLIDKWWDFLDYIGSFFRWIDPNLLGGMILLVVNLFLSWPVLVYYYIFCEPHNFNELQENVVVKGTTNDCGCIKNIEINNIKKLKLLITNVPKITILINLPKLSIF